MMTTSAGETLINNIAKNARQLFVTDTSYGSVPSAAKIYSRSFL